MRVATPLPIFTLAISPASWTTKRSRRTAVSMVVAANRTAIVARTVALTDAGRPRPSWTIAPPPVTNAPTPASPKAL